MTTYVILMCGPDGYITVGPFDSEIKAEAYADLRSMHLGDHDKMQVGGWVESCIVSLVPPIFADPLS